MRDLKACTVCLSTSVKLHNMDSENLRMDYNLFSGLKTNKNNGLPSYLCVECYAYIRKSKAFREKCQRAYFALQEMLKRNKEITTSSLQALNTQTIGVARNIAHMDIASVHWEQMYSQWNNNPEIKLNQSIYIAHYSTYENIIEFSSPVTKVEQQSDMLLDTVMKCSDPVKKLGYSSDDCVNEPDNVSDVEENEVPLNDESCSLEPFMTIQLLSLSDARASLEIINTLRNPGPAKCECCFKGYINEDKLRFHQKNVHEAAREHSCAVCGVRCESGATLRRHARARHSKYTCRACAHVSFDRASAQRHLAACGAAPRTDALHRAIARAKHDVGTVKKKTHDPDFDTVMTTTLLAPLEMYSLVEQRKQSRNYTGSRYRCEQCYRGFTCSNTYNNHMKKHDERAGRFACDVCGVRAATQRSMYKHMISTHIHKYACTVCDFLCFNRSQAFQHYRFHRNHIYKCPHCPLEFKKSSTHLTHIRIKHPSTRVCDICGHSFVSLAGMRYHRVRAHSAESYRGRGNLDPLPNMVICIQCNNLIPESDQHYRLSDLGSELVVEELINVKPSEEEYICDHCFRGLYRQPAAAAATPLKLEHDDSAYPPLVERPVIVIKNECVWPELQLQETMQDSCGGGRRLKLEDEAASDEQVPRDYTILSGARLVYCATPVDSDTAQVPSVAAEIEVADTEHDHNELVSLDDIKIEPMDEYSVDIVDDIKLEDYTFTGDGQCFGPTCWMPESSILKTQNMFRYRQRAEPRSPRAPRGSAGAAARPRQRREYKRRGDSEVHNNGVTVGSDCEVCGIRLTNDVQARKHYTSEHPGVEYLRRYMCDICGHTTKQYSNLLVHMRRHTLEKPFACPHCDRRFSMPSNRDRHLLIHTGEKPYECVHCHRRFTQSTAMKLHVQTVHLKIPYAPWDRKNRKRKKEEALAPAPLSAPAAPAAPAPAAALAEPKLIVDATGEYINAYLTYGTE